MVGWNPARPKPCRRPANMPSAAKCGVTASIVKSAREKLLERSFRQAESQLHSLRSLRLSRRTMRHLQPPRLQ